MNTSTQSVSDRARVRPAVGKLSLNTVSLERAVAVLERRKALLERHAQLLREVTALESGIASEQDLVLHAVLKALVRQFGIPVHRLLSKSRFKAIVHPRMIGMWLVREMSSMTLDQIGVSFGNRDHCTVLYAWHTVNNWRDVDPNMRKLTEALKAQVLVACEKGTQCD